MRLWGLGNGRLPRSGRDNHCPPGGRSRFARRWRMTTSLAGIEERIGAFVGGMDGFLEARRLGMRMKRGRLLILP